MQFCRLNTTTLEWLTFKRPTFGRQLLVIYSPFPYVWAPGYMVTFDGYWACKRHSANLTDKWNLKSGLLVSKFEMCLLVKMKLNPVKNQTVLNNSISRLV